jgi:hypothetical protein
MTRRKICEVQEFLTMVGEDRVYQIVNVEILLKRHPPEAVYVFLHQLRKEYQKELRKIIANNKTDFRVNEIVAKLWRIKMAMNTIKNAGRKEVSVAA